MIVTVSGGGGGGGGLEEDAGRPDRLGSAVVSGADVTVCIDIEGSACSVIVVGTAEVTVTTMVVGVSDSVMMMVDNCV